MNEIFFRLRGSPEIIASFSGYAVPRDNEVVTLTHRGGEIRNYRVRWVNWEFYIPMMSNSYHSRAHVELDRLDPAFSVDSESAHRVRS